MFILKNVGRRTTANIFKNVSRRKAIASATFSKYAGCQSHAIIERPSFSPTMEKRDVQSWTIEVVKDIKDVFVSKYLLNSEDALDELGVTKANLHLHKESGMEILSSGSSIFSDTSPQAPPLRSDGVAHTLKNSIRSCSRKYRVKEPVAVHHEQRRTKTTVVKKKDDKKKAKVGKIEQLKGYFKEYGWVFVTYWTGVWASNGVLIYVAIEAAGLDGIALLKSLGSDSIYDIGDWDPKFLNALIAIEVNELLELVRFPIIVATTPKVAKWWRSR